MLATRPKPITYHNLPALSMTKLEELFASYSKDRRNSLLRQRRHNWDAMITIMGELAHRCNQNEDDAIRLRYVKASLRLARRAITSARRYGRVLG